MSNMILNVEFLAGTDIHEAISEAKEKAAYLNIAYVCFKFNGSSFSIGKNANVISCYEKFISGVKHIIAS